MPGVLVCKKQPGLPEQFFTDKNHALFQSAGYSNIIRTIRRKALKNTVAAPVNPVMTKPATRRDLPQTSISASPAITAKYQKLQRTAPLPRPQNINSASARQTSALAPQVLRLPILPLWLPDNIVSKLPIMAQNLLNMHPKSVPALQQIPGPAGKIPD